MLPPQGLIGEEACIPALIPALIPLLIPSSDTPDFPPLIVEILSILRTGPAVEKMETCGAIPHATQLLLNSDYSDSCGTRVIDLIWTIASKHPLKEFLSRWPEAAADITSYAMTKNIHHAGFQMLVDELRKAS